MFQCNQDSEMTILLKFSWQTAEFFLHNWKWNQFKFFWKKRIFPRIIAMDATKAASPNLWKNFCWKLGNTSVIVGKWYWNCTLFRKFGFPKIVHMSWWKVVLSTLLEFFCQEAKNFRPHSFRQKWRKLFFFPIISSVSNCSYNRVHCSFYKLAGRKFEKKAKVLFQSSKMLWRKICINNTTHKFPMDP